MPHSVLVVDDRPDVTRMLTYFLKVDDRVCLAGTAKDGVEALEQTNRGCPDAIILDLEMPRMGGLEALPMLREACPDSVIVMYSSDTAKARLAPELGANALVDKTEDPAGLIDLVVDWCRIKQDPGLWPGSG